MQAVDQKVRAGEPDRAVELVTRIPPPVGSVPAFWEAGHRLHLVAAAGDLGQWIDAMKALRRRERVELVRTASAAR